MKKPAGTSDEIEKHFCCESSKLIMVSNDNFCLQLFINPLLLCLIIYWCLSQVGDRPFTDVVFGNRNGFLTILTEPLSLEEEPLTVKQVWIIKISINLEDILILIVLN